MAITRRGDMGNSFYGLRQLNRILDDAFAGWPQEQGTITSAWLPPCDVVEDVDSVRIMMELPGVEPDDVRCMRSALISSRHILVLLFSHTASSG